MTCLFCKIIKRELPSKIVYESEKVLAFKDINPQAPLHILIIPKQHIESIKTQDSEKVIADLILAAKEITKEKEIEGYKLLFCVGKEGGQVIEHLHMHLLSGKRIPKKELFNF
ncbi:MAG: HIT domain-containing protein [Patescibacteria group bacterium]|nr:HIT domain-containing protein [Patescibacteria group bacterium]